MTTLNKALEIAKTTGFDAAWDLAKTDETLNSSVTKEQWISFAKNAISRRIIASNAKR